MIDINWIVVEQTYARCKRKVAQFQLGDFGCECIENVEDVSPDCWSYPDEVHSVSRGGGERINLQSRQSNPPGGSKPPGGCLNNVAKPAAG